MAKSKFNKRQVAGALLLSSTAVGTAASSSASAGNVLTDFLSGTKSKIGEGYDYLANTELGKYAGQLGNKISETEVYKNYISPAKSAVTNFVSEHKLATAIVLTASAVLFGVYKYIKNTNLVYVARDAHSKVAQLLLHGADGEEIGELNFGGIIEDIISKYNSKQAGLDELEKSYNTLESAIDGLSKIKFSNEMSPSEDKNEGKLINDALKSLNKLKETFAKYIRKTDPRFGTNNENIKVGNGYD